MPAPREGAIGTTAHVEPLRLRLAGHARPADVLRLQGRLAGALRHGRRELVVDLGDLTVLSSSSMSLLCGALRGLTLTRRGARLRVVDAPPLIARILASCDIGGVELADAACAISANP